MSDVTIINARPVCPQCGRLRQTMCPVCKTAGTEFPWADEEFSAPAALHQIATADNDADAPAAVISDGLMLVCTTCDEPFEPGYARRCEWCGHDFGRGFQWEREQHEPISGRAILIAVCLVAVTLAVFAYFAVIL